MDQTVQKCASRDDDGARANRTAVAKADAVADTGNVVRRPSSVILKSRFLVAELLGMTIWDRVGQRPTTNDRRRFDDQFRYFSLLDLEIGLGFQDLAHLQAIGLLVTLSARRPNRRASGGIQETELDANCVGNFGHDAAEGIDFTDKMPLGDAADRRVTRHLRDEIDVERVERGFQSHAGRSHGGFAAGMTRADNDYFVVFSELPHAFYSSGV